MGTVLAFNNSLLQYGGSFLKEPMPQMLSTPRTLRFRFDPSYTNTPPYPKNVQTQQAVGSWVKVQGVSENLWDYYYSGNDWGSLFRFYVAGHPDVTYGGANDQWTTPCEIITSGDLSSCNLESCFGAQTTHTGTPTYSGITGLVNVSIPSSFNLTYGYAFATLPNLESLRLKSWPSSKTFRDTLARYIYVEDTITRSDASSMFIWCTNLKELDVRIEGLENISFMFQYCQSLNKVPALDYSAVTNAYGAFAHCTGLERVPLLSMPLVTNVGSMFASCDNVKYGALDLYHRFSAQPSITAHTNTFYQCGSHTTTGAAELARIPTSWGGTMA